MKVKIEFNCDGAAFEDDFAGEIGVILAQAKDEISLAVSTLTRLGKGGVTHGRLRDTNGNTVGVWKVDRRSQP